MSGCLDYHAIGDYVKGTCSRSACEQIESHLRMCPGCRHRVETARSSCEAGELSSESSPPESVPETRSRQDASGERSMPEMSSVTQPAEHGVVARPTFAGYEIVEELPRGGQAVVYKAVHEATKTTVALKVLLPGLLLSAKARQRFEQEVDLIASLRHPYIVRIRDSGISSGQYFFAMEYVRGLHLDHYVRSNELSPRQIVALFAKVCDGVSYAHQRSVVHRDLKPSNILVDDRNDPLILDFGLAKVTNLPRPGGADMMLSVVGEIKGTLSYMSPEQASGRTQEVDVRTDVYSLGLILYQLLTDCFPYDVSGSVLSVLRNIESAEPKRPKAIVRRFDSDLEAIILTCLAKVPSARYQSAAALFDDLHHWLKGEPLVARSQSSVYVIGKLMRRHKYVASIVGLLLVIVLSFAFVAGYLMQSERKAQDTSARHGQQMVDLALQINPQTVFVKFLEAWHEDDSEKVRQRAGTLNYFLGKKEREGARFLQEGRTATAALAAFRRRLRSEDQWFADLAVAELFLKRREFTRARAAYQRSYQAMGSLSTGKMSEDGLLKWLVAGRLRHLSAVSGASQEEALREEERP